MDAVTKPHRPLAVAAAVLVAASFAGAAAAQTPTDSVPPDSVVAVEGLEVRATRPTATAGGASVIEARLDSLRLPPAPTLEQALRRLPLIQVRANSRGQAMLALRGTEERQVAVLVDGVPLSLGWDHRADLSVVPLTGAQRVRLVRGLSSVLHGPNVLGGVVEVGVARGGFAAASSPRLTASAGVDHLGGRSLGVVGGAPFESGSGEWLFRAGLGRRARPGVALPGGLRSDRLGIAADGGLLSNTDLEQTDAFAALRYRGWGGSWLSLSASGYTAERGVAPELHVSEPRYWRYPEARRLLAAASGGTGQRETPWGVGDLEFSLGLDRGSTEIHSFSDRGYSELDEIETAGDRTLSVRLLGDHTLGGSGELKGAFTFAEVWHEETILPVRELMMRPAGGSSSLVVSTAYRQRLWSLGAETAWRLGDVGGLRATRLSLGVALDGADTPETGGKPPLERLWDWGGRIGATALAADGELLLHAGLSRRARFPSLRELYSAALGKFIPNPELRPEVLLAGEAGATTRLGDLDLQAVLFHHRLSGAIGRETVEGRYRRVNAHAMHSTGLELVAGAGVGPVALTGDLTLQHVRLVDPGADERKPEYHPGVTGQIEARSLLGWGVGAAAGVAYVGRQFCVHPDLGGEVELDPSARVDLELSREWRVRESTGWAPGRVETTLSLDNVTDAAVYDQCGLPQPGRTLRFGLRFY